VCRIYRKRLWAGIGKEDYWSVWFIWYFSFEALGDLITENGLGLKSVNLVYLVHLVSFVAFV
jgi:hypothetical protein